MSGKRTDYISWDEYFMGVAILSGMRSKDPSTQVGCCIVSQDNKILSMGYNGFPMCCSDDEFPWEREGDKMLEMWGSEDSDSLESDVKKSFSLPECFSWDAEFLIDKLMRL